MNPTDPGWIASPWAYWSAAGLVAAGGLALLWFALWRDRSRGRPRCPRCWYDMTGAVTAGASDSPLTCPECGHDAGTRARLHKTRRHCKLAVVAVLLLVTAWYSYDVRNRMLTMRETWKTAAIPTTGLAMAVPWLDEPGFNIAYTRYRDDAGESRLWLWQDWLLARGCIVVYQDIARSERMRRYAGNWLGDLGRRVDAPIDPLIDALHGDTEDVRRTAASSLGTIGRRAARAAPALIKSMDDPGATVQAAALRALGQIGPGQFKPMDDERLIEVLGMILPHDNPWDSTAVTRDLYLHEMIRRGSPAITAALHRMCDDPPRDDTFGGRTAINLELLTALRRVEGKADPLQIELVEPAELVCTAPTLPKVKIRIVNVDVDHAAVGYQKGGDNRGARSGRWRFEVRDQHGHVYPVKINTMRFGGLSGFGPLEHGESYNIDLDMNAFIDPPPPGKYTVVIQYHNSIYLSDEQDVSNLIVSTSEPIPFTVKAPQ